jgi:CheY-like chemotaxis protein
MRRILRNTANIGGAGALASWMSLGLGEIVMGTDIHGLRVLLVEDEFLICDMLAEALIEHGFEVKAVANASDALRHLTCGSPCDILLTDINLPGSMDGTTLARLARQLRPDLPVVYASGSYRKLDDLDAVSGAVFVPKPYNPHAVCEMLNRLTGTAH